MDDWFRQSCRSCGNQDNKRVIEWQRGKPHYRCRHDRQQRFRGDTVLATALHISYLKGISVISMECVLTLGKTTTFSSCLMLLATTAIFPNASCPRPL